MLRPMYKIGEFARLSQVPIRTLRYYDQIGVAVPASPSQAPSASCSCAARPPSPRSSFRSPGATRAARHS